MTRSLFDPPDEEIREGIERDLAKLSHRSDPETSREAAKKVFEKLGGRREAALYFVCWHPGMTGNELDAEYAAADPRAIFKRLNELEKDGLVERSEKPREDRITGHNAHTWEITEAGRAALKEGGLI